MAGAKSRSVSVPAVSVVVPAYGVAHLVGKTLESLQAQTFPDWEAVVIDDGAPDDVEGALARFADDPRIRLLKTDNGGLATARNRAIAHARAPLIALLDGDDLYEPDYLERMTAAIGADPTLGFVTCDACYFGEGRTGRRFAEFVPQNLPISLERVMRRTFNVYIGSLFRRAAFDDAGAFDPSLRSAEDLDLWIRILEKGWGGNYVPLPLGRYRRRAGSLSSQTTTLLRCVATVYERAEARLAGRPEAAVAADMRRRALCELDFEEGEALVLGGKPAQGIARIRKGRPWTFSAKWYVVMPVMIAFPRLARPLLKLRERLNRKS